jgi:hypothetical protein
VVDASLPDRLAAVRFDLIFPPLVSTTALVFSAWLGFYKPWSRLPWATRSDHADKAQPVRAR